MADKEMEAKSPNCGICEQRNLSVPAEIWCNDCGEGLCGPCKDHHGLSKLSRHHKTNQIAEYLDLPPLVQQLKQFCEVHSESFQMFCKDHEVPCCRQCTLESHEKCKLAILDDMISNVKTSVAFVELEQTIKDLTNNIGKIVESKDNNIKRLNAQKEKINKTIKDKKDEIINHLNKLEDKLVRELEEKANMEETKLQDYIQLAKQKENEIVEYSKMIEIIKQHTSDLQCFLALKQIEEKISALEVFILSEDTSNVSPCQLSFEYDNTAVDFKTLVTRLGVINVVELPAELQLSSKKSKGAQYGTQKTTINTIETITLKIEKLISTGSESISGLTVIPEGIVLSTNVFKTVVCIDRQGSTIFTKRTKMDAYDVEYIPSSQIIAVSSGGNPPYMVILIDVKDEKISWKNISFPSQSYIYGIAVTKASLLFAVYSLELEKSGIYYIDINQQRMQPKQIFKGSIHIDSYIAVFQGNIYYTYPFDNTVTCCKNSGEVVWVFQDKQVLSFPTGIAVDSNGIVYVAGTNSSNIVAISSDGKKQKQLLSKSDGLNYPRAVHYDANKNELLVANSKKTIFICSPCNAF